MIQSKKIKFGGGGLSQTQTVNQNSKFGVRQIVLCALFAALTAVGAFIKIPVPVVPFTLQLLFSTLAGLLLGKRYGALSVLLYIVIGLIGIPVFTEGGGIQYIFKPTFGYIIGFCLGAFVTGAIAHSVPSPSFLRLLAASFAGLVVVYVFGMVYFYLISNFVTGDAITFAKVFIYCFLLVVPGDILLCVVAAVISKRIIPVLRKRGLLW